MEDIRRGGLEEFGLDHRIGFVAPGMDADITVFSGDPLSVYEEPVWVVINGKIIKRG